MILRFSVEMPGGLTRTFELRRATVTFGRARTCTVSLEDVSLSRTHAQIEAEPGGVFLRDLNSRNGTFLGDERVDRVALSEGDEIRIGNTRIVYHGQAEAGELTGPASETARWTAKLFERDARAGSPPIEGGRGEVGEVALRRLLTMIRRIAGELEPERVLTRILDAAIEVVDAERGFLVTVEETQLRIPVARDFWRKDIPSPAFELSRSIALEVVRRGEALLTDDAMRDERFDERVSVHDLKIRSVLCVPLRHEGRVVGAIYLDNRFSRRCFDHTDLQAIELFAEPASGALVASELFDDTRRERERFEDEARRRALESRSLERRLRQLERARGFEHDFSALVGRSEAMREVLALADRFVPTSLPVLISGESGTGKELLARALHGAGPRRDRPFVTLDGGGLSPALMEAELFGAARGAYTGSTQARAGLFEAADRGTLYLSGLGDLDHELQKRLLRVLETGEIRRLGESDLRRVDVRVISATQEDPAELVAEDRLREDLFYRLKGVRLDLPPLRDRLEDLPLLVEHFAAEAAWEVEIGDEFLAMLARRAWPGNVRELRNEVQRLSVVAPRDEDLAAWMAAEPEPEPAALESGQIPLLREAVDALEADLVRRALDATEGNKTKAAELLGLSRLGLRKKMSRLGLTDD
jgi:transcriptional regulator with GAF, ATPase, and Fis domain